MRTWLRQLSLPIALHLGLWLGVYQLGFTNEEMSQLAIDGPSHLIDAYVKAARVHGPFGIVRAYLRGEQDERLYYEYARLLLHGQTDMTYVADRQNDPSVDVPLPTRAWPYRDVRVEYPPLAFLAIVPPAWFASGYHAYRWAFIAFMLLLHFLNLWLAFRLLQPAADNEARARAAGRTLWCSLLFCAGLGLVLVTRMDHLVTTWCLLALHAFARAQASAGSRRLAWAAACGGIAAAGVMTKLVPGLIALAAIALWLRSGAVDRLRCSLACALTGAAVIAVVNLAMLGLAGERYLDTFRYHGLRGVQLESLYAGVILLLKPLGLAMHIDESYGSTNLASAATELVKPLSLALLVAALGYVLLRRRFSPDALGATALGCVLLLSFILTNRVFSPQYLIWIGAPLCVLAALQPERRRLWLAFLFAVGLSQLIFPRGYPVLKALHPLGVLILDVRNLALVLVTVGLARAYSTSLKSPAASRAP